MRLRAQGRGALRQNWLREPAAAVDTAVRKLVHEGYSRAVSVIRQHREALERVARALLEQETLSASESDGLLA